MNTATLPTVETFNARNYGGEKIVTDTYLVIGIGPSRSDVDELATLRIYSGKSRDCQTVWASLWVHNKASGSGSAKGYGYCKDSAATAEAISNAGILIGKDISGAGERAIEDVLHAIGVACGYDTVRVFRA